MKERRCDVPGCGRVIEGPELARSPRTVKIDGVGPVTFSVTFKGKRPDICDCCLIDAIAKMNTRSNVIDLAGHKSIR